MLMLAPKAPEPFVDVPTPLWTCRFSTEDEKSGKLTQYVPCDSASLNGIPLMVILVDWGLTPLILIPV